MQAAEFDLAIAIRARSICAESIAVTSVVTPPSTSTDTTADINENDQVTVASFQHFRNLSLFRNLERGSCSGTLAFPPEACINRVRDSFTLAS